MIRTLLGRVQYWLRHRQIDAGLVEELESHRAMKQEQLERSGMSREDAAAASRRALGNVTLAREDARSVWIWPWLESVWQDAAFAVRALWRQPFFALIAVVALASAIGFNTSLFTVFNAMAFRPWAVANPDRVVNVFNRHSSDLRVRSGGAPGGFSLAEVRYFAEQARSLEGLVVVRRGGGDQTLGEDDAPAAWVSGNYFDVLGVEMALGRGFTPGEDRIEAPDAVAVLSEGYWRRRFGADPSIVGRQVPFEGVPFTVVGVASGRFTGTDGNRTDVWLPLASSLLLRPDDRWVKDVLQTEANCCAAVAARLAPGVTHQQAAAELNVLDRRFRADRAADEGGVELTGTEVLADPKGGDGSAFPAMFAAVTLVLLLACANVGNLLLARAAARRREMAVRLSLGASRGRLIRQLLTESLVLALVSGAGGLAVAYWLPPLIVDVMFHRALALQLDPDVRVLGYTAALSIASCVLFGLAPALHGTRAGLACALKDTTVVPGPRLSLRTILLTVQVAAVFVLLAAAGLMVRAVQRASVQDLGFAIRDLSVVSVELPARGYDQARARALARELTRAVEQLPGIRLAITSTPPLGSGFIKGTFRLPGAPGDQFNAVYEVSAGYFEVLGIPLVAGRTFVPTDADRAVIVINESMARRYWTAGSAVGRRIESAPPWGGFNRAGELEIVGVVRDTRAPGQAEVESTIYQPLSGRTVPYILVPTNASAAADAVAAAAARLDPAVRVRVTPLENNLTPRFRASRAGAAIAGGLGLLALGLAAVGMFGVFAFWVQQRTHEIGIRMALGARSAQVVRLVVGTSGRAVAIGLIGGFIGVAGSTRLLRAYLFGLSAFDPVAHLGVATVLVVTSLLAAYAPARRAARIDPIAALRHE
jgi:predicted permease